jgi:hypothetical protein
MVPILSPVLGLLSSIDILEYLFSKYDIINLLFSTPLNPFLFYSFFS